MRHVVWCFYAQGHTKCGKSHILLFWGKIPQNRCCLSLLVCWAWVTCEKEHMF